MDNIITIFKNLADASCNQLTELYAEQIECLEQIVEATSQQYRAGTSHALTTPSVKRGNRARKILLTPAKQDNSENKENNATDSLGLIQQLKKAEETSSSQDSDSTHVTPLRSRASSLSGRRRRRRRNTTQEQVEQQSGSDSTKSTSQVIEESKDQPVQETVILKKTEKPSAKEKVTQESTDQKVNEKLAESDDEQDVIPPKKKAANNKSRAKTRVISRKGQANTRRTKRNKKKVEEESNAEETASDEKNLEEGDTKKEENNKTTTEALEIASEKINEEKRDANKDRTSSSNSKEIYLGEISSSDSKGKESLTTTKEEKASPQVNEVSDVEKVVINIDEEHADSSKKETVQQSVKSPVQMQEESVQEDPMQVDTVNGQTEEDSTKLLLDTQPAVNDEKDYMDEEDFGDTIVLSVPQRTDMMQTYESPVQILKKEHRQSLLFYPIDVPIPQSKRDEDKDNQAFKLFDLEKKILALKGNHKTPDKSLLPGQHPPSFLSPSVRKIVEQNSRSFSASPHVSKFFEDEEPLSPETPETKARDSPPKLHIVPTKFVSMSPYPANQGSGNGKKNEMSMNVSTNENESWRNGSHVPELSPIKIDSQPELATNLKPTDKSENAITNIPSNTSKSSKTSLTKRKLDDSSYSASNKRIKISGESVSSSRLSVSSVTSVSSYASVSALGAASSSIGGKPSNLSDHNLSSQQDNKGGWFQNIIGGVNSFLSLNKSKKPEEKKKHPPIKSLQQAEIAKKKENQKKLDKDQKAADLKKKKLRENLEAQKKKNAEEAKNIKDDKSKKIAYQPKTTKPGILTQSSSSNTVPSKGTVPKSSGTLLNKVIKPSTFKKPDVAKLKLKQSLDKQALDKLPSVPRISEENYRLSTNSYYSEDEELEKKRRQNKKIPAWATGTQLKELILRSSQLDPDLIFAPVKTCDLDEIFGTVVGNRERKRTSSRNWSNDEFTLEEELAYKKSMGFV